MYDQTVTAYDEDSSGGYIIGGTVGTPLSITLCDCFLERNDSQSISLWAVSFTPNTSSTCLMDHAELSADEVKILAMTYVGTETFMHNINLSDGTLATTVKLD